MFAIRSMKTTTRHVDVIALIAMIAIAALVAYVSISSSFKRVKRLGEEQQALTTRLNYLTELANTLGQGEETLAMLKQGMDELDRRLPETLDFQEFYRALVELAAKHTILISELKPGEAAKKDDYSMMSVSMKARANFNDFHGFLFEVTNLPRLTKLEHLTLGVSDQQNLCGVDLTLIIYAADRKQEHGQS